MPIIAFATQPEWEAWLAAEHERSKGLWLKIAKKDSGVESVSYAEALEGALCYGWIDGQKGSLDERFWLQRFTPRGRKSKWSRINRDKATDLLERGRLKPAGLFQVEQARADGRWDAAYEAQSRVTVPDDLQRELDRNPTAQAFFATLSRVNRYAILYRLQDAKKPETRARRLAQFMTMLNEQKKLYP
ncbi:MAG TPA: YdeI/OmpD-associated family protein [Chloroflexota bacterium]